MQYEYQTLSSTDTKMKPLLLIAVAIAALLLVLLPTAFADTAAPVKSASDSLTVTAGLVAAAPVADTAKAPEPASDPFSYGDFTWINGNDRRHSALLDSKYVTGRFLLDANYTASNRHPIDHTV